MGDRPRRRNVGRPAARFDDEVFRVARQPRQVPARPRIRFVQGGGRGGRGGRRQRPQPRPRQPRARGARRGGARGAGRRGVAREGNRDQNIGEAVDRFIRRPARFNEEGYLYERLPRRERGRIARGQRGGDGGGGGDEGPGEQPDEEPEDLTRSVVIYPIVPRPQRYQLQVPPPGAQIPDVARFTVYNGQPTFNYRLGEAAEGGQNNPFRRLRRYENIRDYGRNTQQQPNHAQVSWFPENRTMQQYIRDLFDPIVHILVGGPGLPGGIPLVPEQLEAQSFFGGDLVTVLVPFTVPFRIGINELQRPVLSDDVPVPAADMQREDSAKLASAVTSLAFAVALQVEENAVADGGGIELLTFDTLIESVGNIYLSHLVDNPPIFNDWELGIEFRMLEKVDENEEGEIRFRAVNQYERFFLNPEDLRHAPGERTFYRPNEDLSKMWKIINLSNQFWMLDLFVAIYRWMTTFTLIGYNEEATFQAVRVTMKRRAFNQAQLFPIRANVNIDVAFMSWNIPCEVTMMLPLGSKEFRVRFPRTNNNNCFFYALFDVIKSVQITEHAWSNEQDALKLLMKAGVNKEERIAFCRKLAKIRPDEGVHVRDEAALTIISRFFGIAFRIYNTQGIIIGDYVWEGASSYPVELLFLSPDECKEYLKNYIPENSDPFMGHVGILLKESRSYEKCPNCYRMFISIEKHSKESCMREQEHNRGRNKRCRLAYERIREDRAMKGLVTVNRPDISRKLRNARTDIKENVLFYDFETLNVAEKEEIQPYAVGFLFKGEYSVYHGPYVLQKFFAFLSSLENYRETSNQRVGAPIILAAWNGSRFDVKILFRFININPTWRRKVKITQFMMNGGRILQLKFTISTKKKSVNFAVFDPIQFFGCSLHKACVDFGIGKDLAKRSFPHKRMVKHEDISQMLTLDELNDPQFYYKGSEMKNEFALSDAWTEDDMNGMERISLLSVMEKYLEIDVRGMVELCEQFFGQVWTNSKYDCYYYMTISQMGFVMWYDRLPSTIRDQLYTPDNFACYSALRQSTYGGRVFVGRREWTSPSLTQDIKVKLVSEVMKRRNTHLSMTREKYDTMTEEEILEFSKPNAYKNTYGLTYDMSPDQYLQELDFYSLYPSCMSKYPFPIGQPKHYLDLTEISRSFRQTGKLTIGVYRVTFRPATNLFLPALPTRLKGKLVWELNDGEGWYPSIDLETAYAAGYDIDLLEGFVYNSSAFIFKDYVDMAMNIKRKGDEENNPALRAFGKLLANSLYGKMLQSLMSDVSQVVSDKSEMDKFLEKHVWNGCSFIGEVVIMHGLDPEPAMNKPYQLGAFILAYSRRENWLKFSQLHPSYVQRKSEVFPGSETNNDFTSDAIKSSMMDSPVYGDTDSMYVRGDQIAHLNLKNALYHLKNEDEEDRLKNAKKGKPGGIRILWMICLNVKTYAYLYIKSDNSLHVKVASKGISTGNVYFADYVEGSVHFGDDNFEGRLIDLGSSLRANVSSSTKASEFSKLHHVSLKRTFNKNSQTARVTLDENYQVDSSGTMTLPFGHQVERLQRGRLHRRESVDMEERGRMETIVDSMCMFMSSHRASGEEEESVDVC